MVVSSDLENIKEKYGERMMHLCRMLFPTILETEGLLFEKLSDNFAYSRYLYDDIVSNMMEGRFTNYIYSLIKKDEEEVLLDTGKTPEELLNDAGYDLYECKSEEDIQKFKKYFHSREFLCTFKGNRLNTCSVFFAVKKNVLEINRDSFICPMRQDAYGTSVISIQFTKGKVNTLSIKNRYNHIVSNPDATFSNNLENIVPGLTRSFEKTYGLNISQNDFGDFEIPGYVRAKDGKFYKYNYEINNIYYCTDNIIIDNFEVIDKYFEKEKYIIMDYFVVDLVQKRIYLYDNSFDDSFISNLSNIKKIYITKDGDTKNRSLFITFYDGTDAVIVIDKCNRIVSYTNHNVINIGDNFLFNNKYLEKIYLPYVLKIGSNFLSNNILLENISFPRLIEIKDNFLRNNKVINNIDFPSLMKVGDNFLEYNENIDIVDLINLEMVGNNFLVYNKKIIEINALKLTLVGGCFLYYNKGLECINFPNLKYIGQGFITANNNISMMYLPNLVEVGDNFLWCNKGLTIIDMPKLEKVGRNFVYANAIVSHVNFPLLKIVGSCFLYSNNSLKSLEIPELISVDGCFLYNNNSLVSLFAPKLNNIGNDFLRSNCVLNEFDLSSLVEYGRYFLCNNIKIRERIKQCKCNN